MIRRIVSLCSAFILMYSAFAHAGLLPNMSEGKAFSTTDSDSSYAKYANAIFLVEEQNQISFGSSSPEEEKPCELTELSLPAYCVTAAESCKKDNVTYYSNSCQTCSAGYVAQNGICKENDCSDYFSESSNIEGCSRTSECQSALQKFYKCAGCKSQGWTSDGNGGCEKKSCDVDNYPYHNADPDWRPEVCKTVSTPCYSGDEAWYGCTECNAGYISSQGYCIASNCPGYADSCPAHGVCENTCQSGDQTKYKLSYCEEGYEITQAAVERCDAITCQNPPYYSSTSLDETIGAVISCKPGNGDPVYGYESCLENQGYFLRNGRCVEAWCYYINYDSNTHMGTYQKTRPAIEEFINSYVNTANTVEPESCYPSYKCITPDGAVYYSDSCTDCKTGYTFDDNTGLCKNDVCDRNIYPYSTSEWNCYANESNGEFCDYCTDSTGTYMAVHCNEGYEDVPDASLVGCLPVDCTKAPYIDRDTTSDPNVLAHCSNVTFCQTNGQYLKCTECEDGYTLTQNPSHVCEMTECTYNNMAPIEHCTNESSCQKSGETYYSGSCSSCESGYELSGGVCSPLCDRNVYTYNTSSNTCSVGNNGTCNTCKDSTGTYFQAVCHAGKTLSVTSGNVKCTCDRSIYEYDSTWQCYVNNVDTFGTCEYCTDNSGTYMSLTCPSGTKPHPEAGRVACVEGCVGSRTNEHCTASTNCTTGGETYYTCSACESGYTLIKGGCHKESEGCTYQGTSSEHCNTVNYCTDSNGVLHYQCTSCSEEGFYVENDECHRCPDGWRPDGAKCVKYDGDEACLASKLSYTESGVSSGYCSNYSMCYRYEATASHLATLPSGSIPEPTKIYYYCSTCNSGYTHCANGKCINWDGVSPRPHCPL